MSLSSLPLSYCTNVHPGRTAAEVLAGLSTYTAAVRRNLGAPLAAGLWLAQPVIEELRREPAQAAALQAALARLDLVCYTLNAFPYGDFHSDRVKENVYLPDWTTVQRLTYTRHCAEQLAQLMPEGTEGSISTVPLGFKGFDHPPEFEAGCIEQLLALAVFLDELHDETGRVIRLAIEPEPFCILETTDETLAFFERLRQRAAETGRTAAAQRHLGVCFDVCHQSVEFEDAAASIRKFQKAGVRLNKVHITCAVQLDRPAEHPEAREALARYVEPRYLHQTLARTADGRILRQIDLDAKLCRSPPDDFLHAESWRVHFHVPVNSDSLGPLQTTRADLKLALKAVAALEYAPHLEVETYTWEVLPKGEPVDLVAGLTAELAATQELLQ